MRPLFSPLSAAARAQPIDEPSDHEHGHQERDDHADAAEHIGDNNNVPSSMAMLFVSRAGGLLGSPAPDA